MTLNRAMLNIYPLFALWFVVLFGASSISLAAISQESHGPYKIAVLAYKGKEAALQRWGEHGVYLSQQLAPLEFEIVPLTYTENELTRAVEAGQVDFVITNPGHYTELELDGHVTRLATLRVSSPDGILDHFGGTVITLPNRSDLNRYADLAGKKILIPSQSSLGGWQVHLREAISQGVDLRNASEIVELKDHRKVVEAILAGEADAGFVRSDLIEGLVAQGRLRYDQVKVVNKRNEPGYPYLLSTRIYPEWPFAMVSGTSSDLAKKVLQTLFVMPADENAAISAGIHGWTIPGDYSSLARLFREAGIGPYKKQPITLEVVFNRYWRESMLLATLVVLVLIINIMKTSRANRALRKEISERKLAEEKILHQAHFDSLTDLPNRLLSLDRLSQLLKDAQRNNEKVAVMFLDLDDFKKVNDTLGHETGDKLLIEAAERLSQIVRKGDTVGRLGGDEFIILLGGLTSAVDARAVAENLLNTFREAFKIDGRQLVLTTSVGIAVYPDDGGIPSELLRNADSAMYHSKELGRNTYSYFTDEMNQQVSRRLVLEEHMHGSLERGEFVLSYQPQVDIKSGDIISAEALLRWHNPVLGEVLPCEFVPIAEQSGFIVSIGQFVLTEALSMASKWQKQSSLPFKIAINLSPRQFRDPELVTFIDTALREFGVSAATLELEITEGVLMDGHAAVNNALSNLNELGISIAMDDFGTGYSSISYLRNYPFDIMKIDRSFVQDISTDPAARELINAVISMAHGLGLKVVAEGVETEEHLIYLASKGCEIGQGDFFSEPVSAEAMTAILERQNQTRLEAVAPPVYTI